MAHVSDELRFVLAGDLEFAALLRNLLEEPGILQCNRGLISKTLHQADNRTREFTRPTSLQDQGAKRTITAKQRDDQCRAESGYHRGIAKGVARSLEDVGHLQGFAFGNGFAKPSLSSADIELLIPNDDLRVKSGGLAELK